MFDKENQTKLKAEYKVYLADVWKDQKMIDHCAGEADVVVKFRDNYLVEVEKESIETNFCFGYGWCGVSDEDDYRGAQGMAEHARTSEQYFISENLKGLDRMLREIADKDNVLYFQDHYYSQKNHVLKHIIFKSPWDKAEPGLEKLTDAERKLYAEAVQVEKDRFTKRLNTYLKRFGLSKVRSWSYLVD